MALQNYGAYMGSMADTVAQPVNAFLQARQNREVMDQRNALVQQQQAEHQAQLQAAQQQQQDAATEAQHQQQARVILAAGRAGNPQARAYALKMLTEKAPPEVAATMAQTDPETAWPHIEAALAQYLGEKPQEQPAPISVQDIGGAKVVTQGGKVIGSPKWPDATGGAAADGQYRLLSPEEVAGAGLPRGTSAQVGPNGKVDVLAKGVQQELTPKDASAAQVKLRQIQLAKRQLALVRQKFGALKGSFSSGLGGNYIPSESGKQADAAVNSMRDTLTSITRVPGIGAMSDYETRLQQAKFPDRGQYESVSEQQIQSLQDTLDLLESGYREMLNGNGGSPSAAPANAAPPPKSQAPAAAIEYLRAHPETKAAFFKKYGYLP